MNWIIPLYHFWCNLCSSIWYFRRKQNTYRALTSIHTHWWQRIPCKVPLAHSYTQLSGSVSCWSNRRPSDWWTTSSAAAIVRLCSSCFSCDPGVKCPIGTLNASGARCWAFVEPQAALVDCAAKTDTSSSPCTFHFCAAAMCMKGDHSLMRPLLRQLAEPQVCHWELLSAIRFHWWPLQLQCSSWTVTDLLMNSSTQSEGSYSFSFTYLMLSWHPGFLSLALFPSP